MQARSMPDNRDIWKGLTITMMSFLMSINFCMVLTLVERYIIERSFYNLNLNVLPTESLNGTLAFIILYFLPMVLVNYFLIFHKNRYDDLIRKYKLIKKESGQGKLFLRFLLISTGVPIIALISAIVYVQIVT